MIIETKFNVGDVVYCITDNKIKETTVRVIEASINDKHILTIRYATNIMSGTDKVFYLSKEEAGIAWLKAQGLDCGLKG